MTREQAQREADRLNNRKSDMDWRYAIEKRADGLWYVFSYWANPAFYSA